MLKDTIYIYQFQDPIDQEPSHFNWCLDYEETELNHKLLGINDKDNENTNDLLNGT